MLAGTIPAVLKALTTLSAANASFEGNQLSDCGLKDTSGSDCAALLSLGASWSLWAGLTGTTYCSWPSVTCSPTSGRVAQLALGGSGRSGTLPAALGSLSALSVLDLSKSGALNGTLDVLAADTALRTLLVDGNQFTGAAPAVMLAALAAATGIAADIIICFCV